MKDRTCTSSGSNSTSCHNLPMLYIIQAEYIHQASPSASSKLNNPFFAFFFFFFSPAAAAVSFSCPCLSSSASSLPTSLRLFGLGLGIIRGLEASFWFAPALDVTCSSFFSLF